ncbi:YqcI/YcgG family protein [Silvibacterium acidisoli]|uniref:YqcI/YcgG family protein n=1 Tax=Acidobacteriaceae bacterium ZG23-2 TaxID=2883246 RepID=UPI00406BEB0F
MSFVEVAAWANRVLDHGKLGIEPKESWKLKAYNDYRAKLRETGYPCFFGQTAEIRGEMIYTFVSFDSLKPFVRNMSQFVHLIQTRDHERSSLVAFFKPDPGLTDHTQFTYRFWSALQFLRDHDEASTTHREPEDPLWEFSFDGCEMFVVGASPTYRQRGSRNLGDGMVLIFQPRVLFIDPETSEPISGEVRRRIHKRMLTYDGMPVHPDIGLYGQDTNREWKQYVLADDNSPEDGRCPFHPRQK